jgi:hypothetical protein
MTSAPQRQRNGAAGRARSQRKPMLLDEVFCAIPPSRPETAFPTPLTKTPPLTDRMSVRFHPASLAFWQRVVSPTVFKIAVSATMRKPAATQT